MVKPETVREKSLAPRVGSETKEIENQPRLKKCNLESNLTCNIHGTDYKKTRFH